MTIDRIACQEMIQKKQISVEGDMLKVIGISALNTACGAVQRQHGNGKRYDDELRHQQVRLFRQS